MEFVWILKESWFAVSPSPFSFAFYTICGILGAWLLIKRGAEYRRAPWLLAFVESLMLIVAFVLVQDTLWLVFNTWKWIVPMYSDVATFWNYYVRFAQNLIGLGMMLFLTWDRWKAGWFRISRINVACFVIVFLWLGIQFDLAPNQAYTDWMFAVANEYPDWLILQGFLLNVGMKALLAVAFLSTFYKGIQIEDSSIGLYNETKTKQEGGSEI